MLENVYFFSPTGAAVGQGVGIMVVCELLTNSVNLLRVIVVSKTRANKLL